MAPELAAQNSEQHQVDANSIRHAYTELAPFIVNTPVVHSATFSDMARCQVLFNSKTCK